MIRQVGIIGTGVHKPRRLVTAAEIDARIGAKPGTALATSGVDVRYFVEPGDSAAALGAAAAEAALRDAGLKIQDIDAIIGFGNTRDQPLPGMAPRYKALLCDDSHPIPAWDINAVCLGFVAALDTISYLIDAGRYNNVLLIGAEVGSIGVNWSHVESACLFGDGAAAAVVGRARGESKIITGHIETYASGLTLCEARGGGIINPPWNYTKETDSEYRFHMDGRKLFKHASEILPGFVARTLRMAETSLDDIKLMIPHQASRAALRLIPKRLGFPEERFYVNVQNHGNLVAASIPTAIHDAVKEGRLRRGDRFMIIGTSAGMSIGAIVADY